MDKIRIGIIGMGRMGLTHFPIINTHPAVEIVSVSDTSDVILSMIKKYIPSIKTYTDYKELLNANNVDGVIVCTPSFLHYEICKLACENGISVFCEKPFTTSPAHAKALSDAFENKGLINQVGYVNRYNPVFNYVKKYIESGIIGNLAHIKAEFYSCTIIKPQKSKGWRSRRENGGGATYEMGAHILDILNFILGAPINVYGSMLNSVYSEGVEDMFSTNLIFANNVSASVFVNWSDITYRKPMMKLEFFGSKGKIMADFYGLKIYSLEAHPDLNIIEGWNTFAKNTMPDSVPFYVRGNGYTHQLYDFVDAILDKSKSVICTFADAAITQDTIHKIFDNSVKL